MYQRLPGVLGNVPVRWLWCQHSRRVFTVRAFVHCAIICELQWWLEICYMSRVLILSRLCFHWATKKTDEHKIYKTLIILGYVSIKAKYKREHKIYSVFKPNIVKGNSGNIRPKRLRNTAMLHTSRQFRICFLITIFLIENITFFKIN